MLILLSAEWGGISGQLFHDAYKRSISYGTTKISNSSYMNVVVVVECTVLLCELMCDE